METVGSENGNYSRTGRISKYEDAGEPEKDKWKLPI
jgi:hypothetical protein